LYLKLACSGIGQPTGAACDAELRDPNKIFQSLNKAQLEELLNDIESYRQLQEKEHGPFLEFWQAVARCMQGKLLNESYAQSLVLMMPYHFAG
jgi:hypothetical protein